MVRPVRRLTGILFFGLVLFTAIRGASADDAPAMHYSRPEVRKEIVAVVEGQLAAFRANDYAQAYTFAARQLREQFTAKQFTVMIVRGYPVIAQNKRAECGLPMDDGSTATLVVEVFASEGRSGSYRYTLLKEAAGWRIAGVVENKPRTTDA
jgi:hypothetical protein